MIGTSTKVDVSKVDASSINDEFFARVETAKAASNEFLQEEKVSFLLF